MSEGIIEMPIETPRGPQAYIDLLAPDVREVMPSWDFFYQPADRCFHLCETRNGQTRSTRLLTLGEIEDGTYKQVFRDRLESFARGCASPEDHQNERCARKIEQPDGGVVIDFAVEVPPKPESDTSALRDEVIAGLRDLGWPEPSGTSDLNCWEWAVDGASIAAWFIETKFITRWWRGQHEGGSLFLRLPASRFRIVEAIDRLRWVIGLPPELGRAWHDLCAAIPDILGHAARGEQQHADADAGLVPLPPSKPLPEPVRPYEPRKFGEL